MTLISGVDGDAGGANQIRSNGLSDIMSFAGLNLRGNSQQAVKQVSQLVLSLSLSLQVAG